MNKASTFVIISGLILTLSSVALFFVYEPFVIKNFHYLMWVHVTIIALLSYGSWRQNKANKRSPGCVVGFIRGIPLWLALAAVPVAVLVAPLSEVILKLDQAKVSESSKRKSWYEEDGHYFSKLNNETPVEITFAEYQTLSREVIEIFARAWVLFSYGSLILWQYVGRRENAG